jgi:hypothetical protein
MYDYIGMDVVEVRDLASKLRTQVAAVQGVVDSVDTALRNTPSWTGPDREFFGERWEEDKAVLITLRDRLDQVQQRADRDASQQEKASSAREMV